MRIVIVEDSELIRTELARLVSAWPGLVVDGFARGEDEAVDLILEKKPHAVLLDLGLSPGSGLDVLHRIRSAGSTARVAVLTNLTSDPMRAACLAAGASAFFDKDDEVAACLELLQAWLSSGPPTADPINA